MRRIGAFYVVAIVLFGVVGSGRPALSDDASLQTSEPTPPTLSDYLRDSEVGAIALSPDGKKLALVKRRTDGKYRLYTLDVDNDYALLSAVSPPVLQQFQDLQWLNNERLGVTIGSQFRIEGWSIGNRRMVVQSPDGSDRVTLFANEDKLNDNLNLATIVSALPNDPDHVLMLAFDRGVDLFKVNIQDGSAVKITRGSRYTVDYQVNEKGAPVIRIDYNWRTKKVTIYSYDPERDRWTRELRFSLNQIEEQLDKSLANFKGDTTILLLDRREGDEFGKLHEYDLKTKEFGEVVYEVEDYDVWNTIEHSHSGETIGVVYVDDRPRYRFFDEDLQKVQTHLEGQLQNGLVQILNVSTDKTRYLIFYNEPWRRGVFLMYDHAVGSLREVADVAPQISKSSTTSVDTFRYMAKDETMIQAYLTFPAGKQDQALPLIVYPHGGPHARDWLDYDPIVQYWATRGYAVFQPNFRGSTGYGRQYMDAGNHDFGGEMINDIASGVRALVRAGRVDPERICAAGISYGGYASLMLSIDSDLLKCSVSINGVVDWERQVKEDLKAMDREDREEAREWADKTIGNIESQKEMLAQQSPLKRVEDVNVPILLIHAKDDDNVDFSNAKVLSRALKRAGKEYEFLELESGGHSLLWSGAKKKVLRRTEAFFYEHIGGADILAPEEPKDK